MKTLNEVVKLGVTVKSEFEDNITLRLFPKLDMLDVFNYKSV